MDDRNVVDDLASLRQLQAPQHKRRLLVCTGVQGSSLLGRQVAEERRVFVQMVCFITLRVAGEGNVFHFATLCIWLSNIEVMTIPS